MRAVIQREQSMAWGFFAFGYWYGFPYRVP